MTPSLPAGYARNPVTGRIVHGDMELCGYFEPLMLIHPGGQTVIVFHDRTGARTYFKVSSEQLYSKPKVLLGALGRCGLWISTDPTAQSAMLRLLNTWEPPLVGNGGSSMEEAIDAYWREVEAGRG